MARRTTERIALLGRVDHPAFPPWIERHRARLGLEGGVARQTSGRVELVVTGAPDLIDALELACSLGPAEVLVERTERESAIEPLASSPRIAHD
jgi:acylphosphatase